MAPVDQRDPPLFRTSDGLALRAFAQRKSMTVKATFKQWIPPIALRAGYSLTRLLRPASVRNGGERGADYYDRTFLQHEHWRRHYTESPYYPLWAVVADRVRCAPSASVLDLGCGPGQVARLLYDQGVRSYRGIDFSPARVQQARAVCPELEFDPADLFESDLLDRCAYDTVVCTEFLEHVEGDLGVISRIRPGARLIDTVPNFPGTGHVRHFTDAESVALRYGRLLRPMRVDSHLASPSGTTYYLIDGVRS